MDTNQVDDTPDVSLIDTDFNAPLNETPSETAAENTEHEGADTQEEQTSEAKEATSEAKDTEATDQPEKEGQETDKQPAQEQSKEEQRQRAYAAYQERQRTKQAVAQQIDQTYGPKSEQELVDEGLDPQAAQIEALRQEMYYSQQRTQIAELNAGMQAEAVQVTSEFDIFNPNSPNYDAEYAKDVEEEYKIAARLQTDEQGIVINAEFPLYDFYARKATSYQRAIERGASRGQQEYQQMLTRTENPGGSSSTSKGDSLTDLEERLGDVVIT